MIRNAPTSPHLNGSKKGRKSKMLWHNLKQAAHAQNHPIWLNLNISQEKNGPKFFLSD